MGRVTVVGFSVAPKDWGPAPFWLLELHITTRCSSSAVRRKCRTARCAEAQRAECSVQSAVAGSAVCSLQSDSFVQCEMPNEGNRTIRRTPCLYAGPVHLPSNHIALYLHSPHPSGGAPSLSAHRFGADATMVRIEWIKRLSGGCRSAHVVDQIQHSSSVLLFGPVEYLYSQHTSTELPKQHRLARTTSCPKLECISL